MQSTATLVLSAYRGQAKAGIGEGPDSPIAHGEQYLEGTAPELARDGELLQAIRPWSSLDSDSADHQRLKDQLEAWSCFCYRDWLFVVRLMSAGAYDRRAAYFSHARAWRLADCREDFDPGAYLGCSNGFDTPRTIGTSAAQLETLRPAALPAQWLARLQPEAPVAERFLGHLLQALEQGYPLLVAVPVREFTAGEPFPTLVSFARAALPADLKYRCAIRLYTRQPERFARHLHANLIAVPDEIAGEALGAQRHATLLDRQGEVKAGQPLEQRAATYAQAVMEGALKAPRGLLLFSARFGPRHTAGLPVGNDVRSVQISYNLALALAGAEADRDYLFHHYLRAQAQNAADLPWNQLLDEQDWRLFPRQTLCEWVLQHPDELTAGEQVLQNAVIEALGRLGLTLDEWLPVWWKADDPLKLSRLLQLLAQAPSLLSSSAAAERTAPVSLARLKAFTPLHGLLEAELKAGVLGRRSQESGLLAELAADPDNCRILAAATKAGQLDPTWAHIHINTVDAETLLDAARYLVKNPQDWPCWGKTSKRVLDRLRERGSIPDDLARSIQQLGQTLDFLEHWEIYIRLADLLAPADPQSGAIAPDNSLMQRLRQNLDRLDSPKTHAHLVGIALDEQHWHCLAPASLVLPNGEPALPWADEVAGQLLSSAVVRERLNTAALLRLLRAAGQRLDKEQIQQVYATVIARMRRDSAGTTRALIQWGAWFGWRRQAESELTPSECRTAALAWLRCPLWQDSNAPEVTLETWKQVLDDLQPWLSDLEIQQLRGGEDSHGPSLWPWIKPFEADQVVGLCRLANDFGALAELVEAVSVNSSPENIINNIRLAYQQSHLVGRQFSFPADAMLWLLMPTPQVQLPVLTLEQSLYLYNYAGHRQSKALQARIYSVAASLRENPMAALQAADKPDLWKNQGFLSRLAEWFDGNILKKINQDFLIQLDQRIDPKLSPPSSPSTIRKDLARLLAINDYNKLAEFLCPGVCNEVWKEKLPYKALKALRQNDSDNSCWTTIGNVTDDLNANFRQTQSIERQVVVEHPLCYLARIIYDIKNLSEIARWQYWCCFETAARKNPKLLRHVSYPQPYLPAFDLAASLFGNGRLAETAQHIIRIAGAYRSNSIWWQALLYSLRNCRRQQNMRSVEDRITIALVEICNYARKYLNKQQQQTLAERFRLEGEKFMASLLHSEYEIERR